MKKVKRRDNESGFIKFIFVVLILASIAYVGWKFGIPYYRYSAFKSDAQELARISIGGTERTRSQIYEKAQQLKLPLEESDIEVTTTANGVRVRASWSETVDLLGLYQKKINFSIDEEG
jgi:hypothetical protein